MTMTISRSGIKSSHGLLLLVLVGTAICLILPLLNGGPFVYYDTSAYIEQTTKIVNFLLSEPVDGSDTETRQRVFGVPGGDQIVIGGRSVFYGTLAYVGWKTSLWLPILLQGFVLSWLVITIFRHLAFQYWEIKSLIAIAVIAILSSASLFAGLVMPDIWSGLLVVALAVLWAIDKHLKGYEKFGCFAVLSFSALAHSSHIALLAVMIGLYVLAWMTPRLRAITPINLLTIPVLALLIGFLGNLSYSTAVRVFYKADLIHRPFITAHLTELGPGARFAQESCPESEFALCPFADRLPTNWIDFLFGRDPEKGVFAVASPSDQKQMSAEQIEFALRTFWAEPGATAFGLIADGVNQLWSVSVKDVALNKNYARYFDVIFPEDMQLEIKNTRVYSSPQLLEILHLAMRISAALSVLVLVHWKLKGHRNQILSGTDEQVLEKVVAIIVAGFVVNALVCGILASPYGRFQARLLWLVPLLAILVISRSHSVGERQINGREVSE